MMVAQLNDLPRIPTIFFQQRAQRALHFYYIIEAVITDMIKYDLKMYSSCCFDTTLHKSKTFTYETDIAAGIRNFAISS